MTLPGERQQQIVRFIRERQRATVEQLSAHFQVSEATIRRDLERLNSLGELRRDHGGAIAVAPAAPEPPAMRRIAEHADEKRQIAAAAARLIGDGETVFLGSGTTVLEVARQLSDRRGLTVITNALGVANLLAGNDQIQLILTGGQLRHSELSMIGHLAEQALRDLRADKVFMGIRAISLVGGLSNEYGVETTLDRALSHFAAQLILVADHSKFERVATAFVAPVSAVHTIVTSDLAPAGAVAELRTMGIQVVIA